MGRVLITPSILAADLGHVQEEVQSVEKAGADWLQIDVMDGHFVPNLTFGVPLVKCLKTTLPLDIHLMVSNPEDRIEEFLEVGAAHITFHAEAVLDTESRKGLIAAIQNAEATAGIAINPGTPLSAIEDVLGSLDLVLIMSVHPGFSGQRFEAGVLAKVRELRTRFPDLMIQMDGGIDPKTAPQCIDAGANNLVAASAIFGVKDRAQAISDLRGA